MRKFDGRIKIGQRSRRLSSSSDKTSSNVATGGGLGGGPDPTSVGGAGKPDRTASARKASAKTELRVSLSGSNSATTRSRSATKIVSPDAASLTYSLNRLFRTLVPTDLMQKNVATDSRLINCRCRSQSGIQCRHHFSNAVLAERNRVVKEDFGGTRHWFRQIIDSGHSCGLILLVRVKPFLKRQKSDTNEAVAFVKAAPHPTLQFVTVNSF